MAITASSSYGGTGGFLSPSQYDSAVSASLNIPLYDGGATAARVKESHVDEDTERTIRDQLRLNVGLEVRSDYLNVINAQSLIQADAQGVTESRESLRLAQVRYKAGVGTLLEVTNAEANLATAETNLASAQFQLQTAYAALLRAEGTR